MRLHEHIALQDLHLSPVTAAVALSTLAETDNVIRLALERGDAAAAVSKAFSSRWPTIHKAVNGGLNFVIAADNGASYAELWTRGTGAEANWYAVTGAGIHEVTDIKKGMPFGEAFDRFLASTIKKADCAPCKKG